MERSAACLSQHSATKISPPCLPRYLIMKVSSASLAHGETRVAHILSDVVRPPTTPDLGSFSSTVLSHEKMHSVPESVGSHKDTLKKSVFGSLLGHENIPYVSGSV